MAKTVLQRGNRSAAAAARAREERRSPCPVACALDLFGDRWTLLVIRDLLVGRSRFRDFLASPEKIPTNILSDRLLRLGAAGLVRQIPAEDGTLRRAYQLTAKGKSLGPILKSLRDWGLRWEKGTRAMMGTTKSQA
jgi:DNA-binding HxlR family transcriptional regulator